MEKSRCSLLCQAIFKCQKKGYKTFEIVKKLFEAIRKINAQENIVDFRTQARPEGIQILIVF